jgi:SAM-dependent methyltransferase
MQPQDYVHLHQLEDEFWWFAGMREIAAALLDPFQPSLGQNPRVLDAGCGTGGNLDWLRRYATAQRIIGIDINDDALNFCQRRGRSRLVKGSVTSLPFADASFDLVTSFDVLIYPPGANADDSTLREMHRVLYPGGICFVRAAAYQWLYGDHDKATNAKRRYSLGTLQQKMEQANFQVLRATYANCWLFPLAVAQRLIRKSINLNRGSDVRSFSKRTAWLNQPLRKMLGSEAHLLKGHDAKLPFGLSAICVARKQG